MREIVRREIDAERLLRLPSELPAVLRRVYAARGADAGSIETPLAAMLPVSSLDGTAEAAERLTRARQAGERVLVVGDFDADGATASALVITCLRAFGFAQPAYLVPDRFRFGYGLSAPLVAEAARFSPDIIITVDNGISSHAGIAAAAERGIEVIVTDHHLPGATLPPAAVIVNPNAPPGNFASKALAGVGVAFYCMAALGQRLAADGLIDASAARAICAECLDLVALGTVADLVPLDFNNRVLVAQGLLRMRSGRVRPGIAALFAAAGRDVADATPGDLGFAIAPRLNAAGRLDDIGIGIECLLATDPAVARRIAGTLSGLNEERKKLQADMQAEADLHLETLTEALEAGRLEGACLYDPRWHQGVVGLVATRIKDQLNRPAVAFANGEETGVLKGSARSVQGVHMRDLLAAIDAQHPHLIDKYGGHAMAAGLSLRQERLADFRAAFLAEVQRHVDQIPADGELLTDGVLEAGELSLELAECLRSAGPWGQGFPEPVFDGRFELVGQRVVGERHLKLTLRPVDGNVTLDGIAFNQPPLTPGRGSECIAAYRLDVNQFRGRRSQQLVVEHIECV